MDTIEGLQTTDTNITMVTEQSQGIIKEANPFAIFVMGIAGVFIFVLLYIAIMKIVAVTSQRNKKTNRK
jgi:Na+-transporting methylmalonyl-CoA/oxaloacetate decarboxylase gamma subunit